MKSKMKMYDVLVTSHDSKSVTVVGRNLTQDRAERRIDTVAMRVDLQNYFVHMVPYKKDRKGKGHE